MSGGHYNYVFRHIEDIEIENPNLDPKRAKFQKLLKLVATAMHDIEWVDSADWGDGDEHPAIDEVFNFIQGNP